MSDIAPTLVSEKNSYYVFVKPSGWITNEASTTTSQPVLQTWVKKNYSYDLNTNKDLRHGIVHRLDKETSGIILIAKNENAFRSLQRQFKERVVKKIYVALVHAKVEPEKGVVSVSVGRLPWRRNRFGVVPGGRESKTTYSVRTNYKNKNDIYSLLELKPETGRTHQIRIHLKHINHPIVSDTFYAGRKTSRKDRLWCPRLFLHAANIEFTDPETKKKVSFESDLPQDLQSVLNTLEKI